MSEENDWTAARELGERVQKTIPAIRSAYGKMSEICDVVTTFPLKYVDRLIVKQTKESVESAAYMLEEKLKTQHAEPGHYSDGLEGVRKFLEDVERRAYYLGLHAGEQLEKYAEKMRDPDSEPLARARQLFVEVTALLEPFGKANSMGEHFPFPPPPAPPSRTR